MAFPRSHQPARAACSFSPGPQGKPNKLKGRTREKEGEEEEEEEEEEGRGRTREDEGGRGGKRKRKKEEEEGRGGRGRTRREEEEEEGGRRRKIQGPVAQSPKRDSVRAGARGKSKRAFASFLVCFGFVCVCFSLARFNCRKFTKDVHEIRLPKRKVPLLVVP